jgi:hypothetical protein
MAHVTVRHGVSADIDHAFYPGWTEAEKWIQHVDLAALRRAAQRYVPRQAVHG